MKTLPLIFPAIIALNLLTLPSVAQDNSLQRVLGSGGGNSSADNSQRISTFGQFAVGVSTNNEATLVRSLGFWSGVISNQSNTLLRISEIDYINDKVEIVNLGGVPQNVDRLRLSNGSVTVSISSLPIECGDLAMPPGSFLVVSGLALDELSSDLGLFDATGALDDPNSLIDYVQWGTAGNSQENLAVMKGIWAPNTSVPIVEPDKTMSFFAGGFGAGNWTAGVPTTNDCSQNMNRLGVIFVDQNASGLNNGRSWGDAFLDLQKALAIAQEGDEIWVAKGTYTPTNENGSRSVSFQLKDGISLYGGFLPGDLLLEERLPFINITKLSGDLNTNDDANDIVSQADNSYHVISSDSSIIMAKFDGFIVEFGNADGNFPNNVGAGLFNNGGTIEMANCIFSDNTATDRGGAIYNTNSGNVTLKNCIFLGNEATEGGGGLFNNLAGVTLINSVFSHNTTGATSNGGGVFNSNATGSIITNCTFSRNSADLGSGIFNISSSPMITNCVFWGNTSTSSRPIRQINILDDSNSVSEISHSIIQGGFVGNQITDANPLFRDAGDLDGPDDVVGNDDDGLQLLSRSPGIDAGDATANGFSNTDIRGTPRFDDAQIEDTGMGVPSFADLGAYERQVPSDPQQEMETATIILDPPIPTTIAFGQVINVRALVVDVISNSAIEGNSSALIQFISPTGEEVESNIIVEDGLIKSAKGFAPNRIGEWTLEITWSGNAMFDSVTVDHGITVDPAETTISILVPQQHLKDTDLTIPGLLSIASGNPGNQDLAGIGVDFTLAAPGETDPRPLESVDTVSIPGESSAQFSQVIPGATFDTEGPWTLSVSTQEDPLNRVQPSETGEIPPINVTSKLGYAILCQGSIAPRFGTREGEEDHKRTIDFVRDVLIGGGIPDIANGEEGANEQNDDIFEINAGQPKTALRSAITEWAKTKMEVPAPLYIVLINHGNVDKFHMYADLDDPDPMDDNDPNILKSAELNEWLMDLEDNIIGNEKIILTLGMCFSGSFIDELSGPGRIILSASAGNERSIRGPGDANIRQGEFFVYLLFRELREGQSLLDSFKVSQRVVRQVSSKFNLAQNNLPNDFPGELGQHPLLDDNDDIAKDIRLVPPTNSPGTLAIARTNPSLFLLPDESLIPLPGENANKRIWAEVDGKPSDIKEIFLEVQLPEQRDPDNNDDTVSESMQAGLALRKQLMIRNDELTDSNSVLYEWPPGADDLFDENLFDKPGIYQLFFYVKADSDSQPSLPATTFVHRRSGEFTPTDFGLISPEDGVTLDFNPERADIENALGIFRWEESQSGAGNIQYIFRLWNDEKRADLEFESQPVSFNSFNLLVDGPPSLSGEFWWDVMAVDTQGNFTRSNQLLKVQILLTNVGLPASIFGSIKDSVTNEILANASVEMKGVGDLAFGDGEYTAQVFSDLEYEFTVSSPGYKNLIVEVSNVGSGEQRLMDISLERQTGQKLLTVLTNPVGIPIDVDVGANIEGQTIAVESGTEVMLIAKSNDVPGTDKKYIFDRWRIKVIKDEDPTLVECTPFTYSITEDVMITAEFHLPQIELHPGWNLISTPVMLDNSTVNGVIVNNVNGDLIASQVEVWKWEDNQFSVVPRIEVGLGYWLWSGSQKTVDVIIEGNIPPDTTPIFSNIGWNLMGVKGLQAISKLDEFDIQGKVWSWNGENQSYIPVKINSEDLPDDQCGNLVPGKGYWIYVGSENNMQMGAP